MDATDADDADTRRLLPFLGHKKPKKKAPDAVVDAAVEADSPKAKKKPKKKASKKRSASPEASDKDSSKAKSKQSSLDDVVAEGLYIATAATRLALKNRILVEVIAEGENFDAEHFIPEARDALLALADEVTDEAKRVRAQERHAWGRFDDSAGTHDYRSRDVGNLRRRRKQAKRTAAELRARAADDDALREVVEAARDAAWTEVSRNIDSTLRIEAARPDLETDYKAMREARMQALMLVDLDRLKTQQRRRAQAAAGETLTAEERRDPLSTAEVLAIANDDTDYAAQAVANGLDPAELE